MRRAISLSLVLLALTAVADAGLRVVTTTSDLGWFAREIGGDRVDVHVLTRGYQDPHYVEPKPSYITKLARADALFYIGLELEIAWLPQLLDSAHNPDIQAGRPGLYSPVDAIDVLEVPTGTIDRALGDVHPFGNPHYWLGPANAASISGAIARRLAALDPGGADHYHDRGERLRREIEARDRDWTARLAGARGLELITYHRTYSYFLDHYGLVALDYIEPKPGVPPSSRHLAELIQTARRDGVALLLIENLFELRHAEFVANRAGVPLAVTPVSVGGDDGIESWFDLLERLVQEIERAAARTVAVPAAGAD